MALNLYYNQEYQRALREDADEPNEAPFYSTPKRYNCHACGRVVYSQDFVFRGVIRCAHCIETGKHESKARAAKTARLLGQVVAQVHEDERARVIRLRTAA